MSMYSGKDELDNQDSYEDSLKGKTLKVYFFLLRTHKSWSGREIQRELGLSSPSLSFYHLNKLIDLGLVSVDDHGMYFASKSVRIGTLRYFVSIGNRLVPRFLFYVIFFAFLLVSSFFTYNLTFHPSDITLVLVLVIICVIFLFETKWLFNHGFQ
ncbi:MAG: winged helix-turn-helix domain-containing protein [Candidatus Thorarchaeota archaeon]